MFQYNNIQTAVSCTPISYGACECERNQHCIKHESKGIYESILFDALNSNPNKRRKGTKSLTLPED
jgi:hypothetical protein